MTKLTAKHLRAIAGPKAKPAILAGVVDNLGLLDRYGITAPHRLAHFISQTAHEADRFATTEEYASGAAYEGRHDLGNTRAGDGRRFKGHGIIQVTGRANHRDFARWARANGFPAAPDFEADPERAAEFPWALIGAVWYWQTRKLNGYADTNNIEAITRKINGGLNGYEERCGLYTRTALTLLGYQLEEGVIRRFQTDAGFAGDDVDDIAGQKTRQAMHDRLVRLAAKTPVTATPEAERPPAATPEASAGPATIVVGFIVIVLFVIFLISRFV